MAFAAHWDLWLQMLAATAIILGGAHFLTRAADAIAARTGIGHSFIGVLLLATATSLPELGTGVSSVRIGQPDLAMGSVFGSNLFNLLLVPVLDVYWRHGPILAMMRRATKWIAWLGIGMIGLGTAGVLSSQTGLSHTFLRVSWITWIILAAFFFAMWVLYKRTSLGDEDHVEITDRTPTLLRAILLYVGAAVTVILGAIWLARVGDALAIAYGWQASFVGTQFLALCTSLPELATSIAALHIGAPALAISNILGSNLFNMGFVVFFSDLTMSGPIWQSISDIHALTGVVAIGMTAIIIIAMRYRMAVLFERRREGHSDLEPFGVRAGWAEAVLIATIYLITSVIVFQWG
jgi:cation:H+ antiporter